MKRRYLSLAITMVTGCAIVAALLMGPLGAPAARADNTYHNLAGGNFSQDWSVTTQFTADNDWSGVPSVVGYDGADAANTTAGLDPCVLTTNTLGSQAVSINRQHPSTITNVGVAQFVPGPGSQVTNAVVGIRGSTDFDAPALVFHLNATGRQGINVTLDLVDIDESGANALSRVAVQYRLGNAGAWTNVGCVLDATQGPTQKGLVTPVNVDLPAAANNQPQVQVRVMTYNAAVDAGQGYTSADEWIGIDNIVISSSPSGATPGPTPTHTQPGPTPVYDEFIYLPLVTK